MCRLVDANPSNDGRQMLRAKLDTFQEKVDNYRARMEELEARVAELEERADFSERLLAERNRPNTPV